MSPLKSKWWVLFAREGDKHAKCKTCERVVKTSGNTSNLKSHVEKMHPSLLIVGEGESKSNPSGSSAPKKARVKVEQESSTSSLHQIMPQCSSSSSSIQLQQVTLEESYGMIASYQQGGKRHSVITNHIIHVICNADLPFSLVENKAFINMFKTLSPQYKVPTRKTIKKYIMEKYDVAKERFKAKFANLTSFCITTDIWTESFQTRSFLGVTLHFLNNNKQLDSCTLGVFELDESHTSEYIAAKLISIFDEWGLKKELLHSAVTDGATNMVKAIDIAFGKNKHIVCFAHLLNLVAFWSIEAIPEIKLLIDKVKRVVTWFKHSVRASDELRAESCLKLIQSVETRWNSTYEMIERFLHRSPILNSIIHRHTTAPSMTSAAENCHLKEIMQLLEPLQSATKQLSGEKYATSSIAIPIATNLHNRISNISTTSDIGVKFKEAILNAMKKRLKVEQVLSLSISTLLDPRWKSMYFRDAQACANSIQHVKNTMKKMPSPPQTGHGQSSDSDTGDAASSSFFGDHAKMVQKTWKTQTSSRRSNLPDELSLYLKSPAEADPNKCPLSFWNNSRATYPELSEVAIRYLASTCTSVPSE